MTVAEARQLLATLPDDAPLCYSDGDLVVEMTEIDLAAVVREGDHFAPTADRARHDALLVAVVI